jgi:uncharacterized protein (TIGR00159 family)
MPAFFENISAVLRWQDIFDILLNSYILFRLYILLRGTRLLRMTLFIALLFLFQRVFSFSGMIITRAVIQSITALMAIGVLIVFRNEIRGIFQSKSIRDLFWSIGTRPVQTPIKMLSESAFHMARKRIGALMVFPLRHPVDSIIQNGIPWNGKISREMIESIFWPGNPVHDGAAVIRGDEVVLVGGLLPFSQQEHLPSHFGTRHRAALGLAEQSDALVVVVSEERGEVAVAAKGKLEAVRNTRDLEKRLQSVSGSDDTAAPRLIKSERWSAVLAAFICLLIVSSIWSSVSLGVVRTLATVEAPVEYVKRNPEMEIIESSATSIKIQLSGSRALISTLGPDQVKVRFDLTRAEPGKNILTITEDNILLPPGASIKKIEPSSVGVILDVLDRKRLPIQVDWVGRLPPDTLIQHISISPNFAEVVGGRLILDNVKTLYTQKISVDDITQSGVLKSSLQMAPPTIKLAPGQTNTVDITYTVAPRQEKNGTK